MTYKNAAVRANQTRVARQNFVNQVGEEKAEAIRLLVGGWTPNELQEDFDFSVESLRAIKAHVTMGDYAPYVAVWGGTCNYDVY